MGLIKLIVQRERISRQLSLGSYIAVSWLQSCSRPPSCTGYEFYWPSTIWASSSYTHKHALGLQVLRARAVKGCTPPVLAWFKMWFFPKRSFPNGCSSKLPWTAWFKLEPTPSKTTPVKPFSQLVYRKLFQNLISGLRKPITPMVCAACRDS